jgi:hypothetical protein
MQTPEVLVKQLQRSSSLTALGLALGLGALVGCGQATTADDTSAAAEAQKAAVLKACHLDDGSVDHSADVRACDPQDDKKTTICHLPPGNPANAHTLCIGNAAVAAHLKNHHDYLGACKMETPCPPPPAATDGGVCIADDDSDDQRAVAACHLDDGSVEKGAKVHACDPQDDKKTTICHLPPGNPANAHTLCIGNPAVAAHLANHHDYLGPCKAETACPPAPPKGGNSCPPPAGNPGTGGTPGGEGTGGTPGVPGGEGTGGTPGVPGGEGTGGAAGGTGGAAGTGGLSGSGGVGGEVGGTGGLIL